MTTPMPWARARAAAHAAGLAAALPPIVVGLQAADGLTLATPITTLTELPAFPTSSVDGYAARGPSPWRLAGRVLAGGVAAPLAVGDCVEIATGAMVPSGTEVIVRVEDSTIDADGRIAGSPRPIPDWRDAGDEAGRGEDLIPAGTPVTPGVVGLAAACGYDTLAVIPAPRVAIVIFGDELLTDGLPGEGRVRDSLGPQVPAWLRRLGTQPVAGFDPLGPVADTLDAHIDAVQRALAVADVVCTTGGTMQGPVDHVHPTLEALGAEYIANTVAVRPGFPMLVASVPGADGRPRFIVGLPGNPQSAIVALVSLAVPLLAGLCGRPLPVDRTVTLAGPIAGRGDFTHLSLVRVDPDGHATPVEHAGSAMLRGLAGADGFAMIGPGTEGVVGAPVPLVALPLGPGSVTAGGRT